MLTQDQIKSLDSLASFFDVTNSNEALRNILTESHQLWQENLKNIKEIKYIMFCEAPPFDENGGIENYIYKRDGLANGMYLKAPYKALNDNFDSYPSKGEMIDFLNEKGLVFIDILPLSIDYSSKRNNVFYSKFLTYFWDNKQEHDFGLKEFITQNRLTELKDKISSDVKVCFALKSMWKILNEKERKTIDIGNNTILIHDTKLVGLNGAGQPDASLIKAAFEIDVIKNQDNSLSLYDEMHAIFECYTQFYYNTDVDVDKLNKTFNNHHPRVLELDSKQQSSMRSSVANKVHELSKSEKDLNYYKNLELLVDSPECSNMMKGFSLLMDSSESSFLIVLDLFATWVYKKHPPILKSKFDTTLTRERIDFEMLLLGFYPEKEGEFKRFFDMLANDKSQNYFNSIGYVNIVSDYKQIIVLLSDLENPESVLKYVFNNYLKSEYRWVREATAACPIFSNDELIEIAKDSDRYTLKGCASNPNCHSELKSQIEALLQDESKYPVETNTYTLLFKHRATAVNIMFGEVDTEHLIDVMNDSEDYYDDRFVESFEDHYDLDIFGAYDTCDTLTIDNREQIDINLEKNEQNIVNETTFEVINGRFFFNIWNYHKVYEASENWKTYTIELEGFFDLDKVVVNLEKYLKGEGNGEDKIIEGYSYKSDDGELLDFECDETYETEPGNDEYTLFVGHEDKWKTVSYPDMVDFSKEESEPELDTENIITHALDALK